MTEKMVRCGNRTTCSTCHRDIQRGELALRRSERAVTYHERMHMDHEGRVSYYHHPKCRCATAEVAP